MKKVPVVGRTLEVFGNLLIAQAIGCTVAFLLGAGALYVHGFTSNVIVPLSLSTLVFLVGWMTPQAINELMEINDQLAGRSPEFYERLRKLSNRSRESD